jgi:hypothetical protein
VEDGAYMPFMVFMEENNMTEVLRTRRDHWRRLSPYSSKLSTCGQLVICLL